MEETEINCPVTVSNMRFLSAATLLDRHLARTFFLLDAVLFSLAAQEAVTLSVVCPTARSIGKYYAQPAIGVCDITFGKGASEKSKQGKSRRPAAAAATTTDSFRRTFDRQSTSGPPSNREIADNEKPADPVSAVPVQHVVCQTGHLTLSTSGKAAASSSAGGAAIHNPCLCRLPDRSDSLATVLFATVTAAQPCPQIEHKQAWSPPVTPQSIVGEGVWQEVAVDAAGEMSAVATSSSLGDCPWAGRSTEKQILVDEDSEVSGMTTVPSHHGRATQFSDLPNEVLLQILGYLDVCDLLVTSRTSHHLRRLSLAPILHHLRLRRTRAILPPMLASPSRPSLADLIRRSIFMTNTTVVSRKLARSLVAIRLSRRLAARPSAEALVERCVLPPECIPGKGIDGSGIVAPALVARKRAVERERVKDGLRRWVGSVWRGEVQIREEGVRRWEERVGVGRVWRLRRFWERVGTGDIHIGEN
ncbi:hypothetical protein B0H66DRAFT_604112 [Apodospora peruviana]|uniref:F-box domain-containing protein n=1 Tax=Apodospora peruviana TaxID=516989 RepID=A0AAE0M1M0_9PEZI|nr:hypothetical protein B0H66DRAFT_604112 [Apodospora peruviana]